MRYLAAASIALSEWATGHLASGKTDVGQHNSEIQLEITSLLELKNCSLWLILGGRSISQLFLWFWVTHESTRVIYCNLCNTVPVRTVHWCLWKGQGWCFGPTHVVLCLVLSFFWHTTPCKTKITFQSNLSLKLWWLMENHNVLWKGQNGRSL